MRLIVDFSFLICHNICMKKKVLIVTLFGLFNHGNRLQNYALQKLLLRYFDEVYSLMDTSKSSKVYRLATAANASFSYFISKFHSVIGLIKPNYGEILKKYSFFYDFNRRIKFIKCEKIKNTFDYFVTGSDQVWNFTFKLDNDTMFLNFTQSPHKISYAASIGMRELSKEEIEYTSKSLSSFKAISVRENDAKDLIQPLVDKPVEVVLDPTLMLTADEWDKVIKKPKFIKKEKFILQYVLGSDSRLPSTAEWTEICGNNKPPRIVDIRNENSEEYYCGPAEFVWMIKNSEFVVTDSFHAVVFSLLYHKPVLVLQAGTSRLDMNGRFETLCQKLNISFETLTSKEKFRTVNYGEIETRLQAERSASLRFLEEALKDD